MRSDLAIVIPAYKGKYFKECLQSVANQTKKAFTVYIGDDASDDNLEGIVSEFKGSFRLVYRRFNVNIGKDSLASHWNRCLLMIENERWIWLFPDDDIMEPLCVERFLETVAENSEQAVYRFDINITDREGKVISTTQYPTIQTGEDFFLSRLKLEADSVISNYIFHSNTLKKKGFISFPLGWCSDDATIIREVGCGQIYLIPKTRVLFRLSDENISGIDVPSYARVKVESKVKFLNWIYETQKFSSLQKKSTRFLVLNWIVGAVLANNNDLSESRRKELILQVEKITSMSVALFNFKKKCHYLLLKMKNLFQY